MKRTLYVLGNGFDLHHNLKTSYYDFSDYLQLNNRTMFDVLEEYIGYPQSENNLWSKFEQNLANLNIDEILSESSDYLPNIADEEFKDRDLETFPQIMREKLEQLTIGLISEFKKFIKAVEIPEDIYSRKVELNREALFLNFNYTNTLEKFYNIKPKHINYIHNTVFGEVDIILGHGIDPKNFEKKIPDPPAGIDADDLDEWYSLYHTFDYSYDKGREILNEYFKEMYKPTEYIVKNNQNFFDSMSDVNEIFIFGHSISDVDILYFKQLAVSVSQNANWYFSYYSDEEKETLKDSLLGLGINLENLFSLKLNEIQINNVQLRLDL
jgi:hypothetical protein